MLRCTALQAACKRFLSLSVFFWSFSGHVLFAQSAIDRVDIQLLEHIAAKRTPGQTQFFRTISDANNYVNAAIPAGLFIAGALDGDKGMRQNAAYIAVSTASTAVLNMLIKRIVKRPRPFRMHIQFHAVYEPSGYSFPSGHTSASFSTATALSRAYSKWYVIAPSFIWASSVGYSRMYLGVHNPSDVLAGAALGAANAFGFDFLRK